MSGKNYQNYNDNVQNCPTKSGFVQQKLAVCQTAVLQLKKDLLKTGTDLNILCIFESQIIFCYCNAYITQKSEFQAFAPWVNRAKIFNRCKSHSGKTLQTTIVNTKLEKVP